MIAQWASMARQLMAAFVAALLFLGGISLAQAHDFGGPSSSGPPDDEEDPGCNCPPCSGPAGGSGGPGGGEGGPGGGGSGGPPGQVGNPNPGRPAQAGKPIQLYTGAERLTAVDLVVKGQFPIVIQRHYDSRSNYDSPLGYGWAFAHDRRLYEYPDSSVVVRHGCGTRDRYVFSGGAYVTPTANMLATLSEEVDGSFRLRYLNGMTDVFDSQGRLVAAVDATGNRHEFTYDARGKLPLIGSSKASVSPTQPMTVAYNYRLVRIDVRAADGTVTGRYVTFEYDETTGRLTSVTADDGRSVSYQHDETSGLTLGNLTQVNGLEGTAASYAYSDPLDVHNLTSITPVQGRTPIINTYDNQDRVVRQEEGARRLDIVYDVPYTRTTVTKTIKDQNGLNPYTASTAYEFDITGRVTKITDPLGHEQRYTFDGAKMLRREEIWQKDGATLTLLQAMDWTYDASGNKLTEVVVLDNGETITRSWTYDHNWIASEQVVSSAAPSKIFRVEYTFHYDADGRPTNVQSMKRRRDDGTFQTTSYAYDNRNRLLTTTLPDGVQIVNEYTGDYVTRTYFVVNGTPIPQKERRFEYDAEGNLIKEWDARGNVTQYGYDQRRRITSVTDALNQQTLYIYSGDRLTQVETGRTSIEGEGQVTRFLYDSRDRQTGIQRKNDAGAFVTYEIRQFDSEGGVLAVTDGENRTTSLAYDVAGRLRTITDPAGNATAFTYDARGNRTSVVDALNRETRYEYDDMNRLTAMVQLGVSPNPRTEFGHDATGNLVTVRDPENHTTSYTYDALSRVTRTTQPLGQAVQYAYDGRDRLDFVINARGNKIDYEYEPWGPLKTERQYPTTTATNPDRTISYTHDDDGHVLSVTDDDVQATAAYVMSYDVLGRPYDEAIRYIPGGDRILRHRYDRYGNRSELTLEDALARTNSYSFNKLNQLSQANLAGAAITLSHFANDDRQSIALPNGVTEQFTYAANGRLQMLTTNGPAGQIAQFLYTFDAAGNIDTQTDAYGTHDYNYDGLDRLIEVVRPTASSLPNESYAYDRVGNREDPANLALYDYDNNNRIVASPGLTYAFDADGSLQTRSDGATFTHDARNRLRQFVKGATTANYSYDAMGRRIRKSVNGADTWFLWDGAVLLAEYDASGNRTKFYGYLAEDYAPTLLEDTNGTYFVHTDHLQTPRVLTGTAGQVVWRSRHEAFGKSVVEPDADGNSVDVGFEIRFPGQYHDSETGLHYNYFRDYDPQSGRYVQSDPLGIDGGVNTYAYALNNPISLIDPFGLLPICETYQVGPAERRTWTEVSHKGIKLPGINMYPTGPGVGPNPSLRPPRKPPIGTQVRWEVWFVWLHFRRDINTTYEQFIRHMVSFCKDKITDACGREDEITLEPSYFDSKSDPIKTGVTETDIYLFTEMVRRLGET